MIAAPTSIATANYKYKCGGVPVAPNISLASPAALSPAQRSESACVRLSSSVPSFCPVVATLRLGLALRYRLVQVVASRRANSTHLHALKAVRFPNPTRIRERKHPAAGHVLAMTFYLRKMYPRGLQTLEPKRAQWGCLPGLAAWPPLRRAKETAAKAAKQ